jgi:hypothetical protein
MSLAGCVATVHVPENPDDPTEVYLIRSGRHLGLILPRSGGGHVEYAYGEWGWFAENHNAWYDFFDTVLWPTPGALGRKELEARDREELARALPDTRIETLVVAPARIGALRDGLDSGYLAARDTEIFNPGHGYHFVEHERRFWCCYSCNDAVAAWLEALDCRVSWLPIRLGLSVRH